MGAPTDAVHLGARATERAVKSLSASGGLARARVLHFATHGLLAAETKTLLRSGGEPALVLTPPTVASSEDDGLLTASEIAGLTLDADWVVLSACNTAASGGGDAEPLSGLARSFFYAGARALLVSHWYVDSDAAVVLIKETFAALENERSLGRAAALQRAMSSLIDQGGGGAHPAYWAPFVVVGDANR